MTSRRSLVALLIDHSENTDTDCGYHYGCECGWTLPDVDDERVAEIQAAWAHHVAEKLEELFASEPVDTPGTLRITDPFATEEQALAEIAQLASLDGEISDGTARFVARKYGRYDKPMGNLFIGKEVDRQALADEVAEMARRTMTPAGWPSDLEALSYWILNHD